MIGDPDPWEAEDELKYCLNALEEALFKFNCFVDTFNRYLVKKGFVEDDTKT